MPLPTRTAKYRSYRAAIRKMSVAEDTPALSAPLSTPIEEPLQREGISRSTTSLPLNEIIKGTDTLIGQPHINESELEKQQNRRFALKVVLICALTAIFIVAAVVWIINK